MSKGKSKAKPFKCEQCQKGFRLDFALAAHMADRHGVTPAAAAEVGPACVECGAEATLTTGEAIYPHRPDLFHKHFWLCACGAYGGCHGTTTRPLGAPCGPATRRARSQAHEWFDRIWRSREMSRTDAYGWLAKAMGMPRNECHIGMMTAAQAWQVVELSRTRALAA